MRTSVAVVSLLVLASAAVFTARDVNQGGLAAGGTTPSAPAALVACHEAGAPGWKLPRVTPTNARRSRQRGVLFGRAPSLDLAQVEAIVTARMPNQDLAFRRELARAIEEEARHAGLDPLLVLAMIHVESAFDPAAVSYAGAIGLMQLRERTLARELRRAGLALTDQRDPVANVRAGIRYLRRLVSAFGSTDLALMAYNAGPNRLLSYYRAGEIPERFHAYPRRIRTEHERLRLAIDRRLRGSAAPKTAG